ncbi:hypothetical protein EPI10_023629 [Gossypium australe]|uniref:Uncharacterized protein n=1 Tax=Gossypium australe TaxID=47621 RepID=A0A5B6VVB7_9ROSI|nr:hypothetical protein EPI10_023629 [Gossypium australe]
MFHVTCVISARYMCNVKEPARDTKIIRRLPTLSAYLDTVVCPSRVEGTTTSTGVCPGRVKSAPEFWNSIRHTVEGHGRVTGRVMQVSVDHGPDTQACDRPCDASQFRPRV